MTHYIVSWTIDIWENTPEKAAKRALKIHRDNNSIATVFEVKTKRTGKTKIIDCLKVKK